MADTSIQEKHCCKCGQTKRRVDYRRNKSNADGLSTYCRSCYRAFDKLTHKAHRTKRLAAMKEYGARNADRLREYAQIYREKHGDALRAKQRAYYQANKKSRMEAVKQYAATHPAKVTEWKRKWRANHPEAKRAEKLRRRGREAQAAGCVTSKQMIGKLDFFGWRCYLCRVQLHDQMVHWDHRKPLSRGGSNWLANLAPACRRCNTSKRNKLESEYRALISN